MTARDWIPPLLVIAILSLLPAWVVGCAALGAALGLWIATRPRRRAKEEAPLPENVVRLPQRRLT